MLLLRECSTSLALYGFIWGVSLSLVLSDGSWPGAGTGKIERELALVER